MTKTAETPYPLRENHPHPRVYTEENRRKMKEVSEGDTVNPVSFRNKFCRRPRGNKGDKEGTNKSTKAGGYMIRITALLAGKHAINNCGRRNHFAVLCRSRTHRGPHATQSVKAIDQEIGPGDDSYEIYTWLATLQMSRSMTNNSWHYGFHLGITCAFSQTLVHSATSFQYSCTRKLLMIPI